MIYLQHQPGAGHIAAQYLRTLSPLGIAGTDPVPRLRLPGRSPSPTIALHPGSSDHRRAWPANHWIKLIQDILGQTSADLLLIAGPDESRTIGGLLARIPPSPRVSLAQNNLIKLAGSLQNCRLYVGLETGITHLAAALGLPTICLWGLASGLDTWRPLGDHVQILSIQDSPAAVLKKLLATWSRIEAAQPICGPIHPSSSENPDRTLIKPLSIKADQALST
jgi:ADP-heptose:LPS heptosyltransferase